MSKGYRNECGQAPKDQSRNNMSDKINNITLDCNSNHKINTHEFMLI